MAKTQDFRRPYLGYGLGLRKEHYDDVLATRPRVDWFEIISENYMVEGGKPLDYLTRIREHYPMVMHGVSMSIGSIEPLNRETTQGADRARATRLVFGSSMLDGCGWSQPA